MKIAITSQGLGLQSKLDSRFGRCAAFALFDTESGNVEFVLNPNKESSEGAGPASAKFLASKEVQKVISGEFGQKVKSIFETLKVEMVALHDSEDTIETIINSLK